jgi:putative ABC transport system substrate-binding protein
MQRRDFIAGTAATAALTLAWPTYAQTNAPTPVVKRIAIVHPTEEPEGMTVNGRRSFKAYFGELNRLGYVEGKNLIVQRHSALGHPERSEDLVRIVVAGQPDLIVCTGGQLTPLFKAATTTIPIVAVTSDPVALGLVTNFARPGGNITGVVVDAGLEVWGKRLQLLNDTAGGHLKNVRYLATSPAPATIAALLEAANRADIAVTAMVLSNDIDHPAYERAFDLIEQDRTDGLILSEWGEHITNRHLIVELAAKHRLPAIYPYRDFVEVGGLLSYGTDLADVMRRAADISDQILSGTRPGEIPVYQPTKFELVLNRTTAKSLGLEFPPTLVAIADEVIG